MLAPASNHFVKVCINMALAPKFGGQLFPAASSQPKHTLELCKDLTLANKIEGMLLTALQDLDYVCPFSAKMFNTIYASVAPTIEKKYASQLQIILRNQIQPWHPSSTLVHEAGAAVLKVAPQSFWAFSAALFKAQKDYFDVNVVNETRNDTYRRLAKLAETQGIDEAKIFDLLVVSDKPAEDGSLNVGNQVTNDIKQLVKVRDTAGQNLPVGMC